MDLFGFLKFLLLNAATVVAGLALAARMQFPSRSERLLAAAMCSTGVALLSALVLGVAGWLRYEPLLGSQVVLAVLALAATQRANLRGMVRLGGWARGLDGSQQIVLGLLAATYAYVVFLGLIGEPFAGDALMYHLPLVAEYAREGRIEIPDLGRLWNNDLWAYYPGNAYLLYQWWVLPFGSDVLVDLVQIPYVLGVALATYVLARKLGASARTGTWSAMLFLSVPLVINQAKTALVDVPLTFLFVGGMTFLLAPRLTWSRLLLAGIAWGAAPGVKLSAIFYLIAGAPCAALFPLAGLDVRPLWRRTLAIGLAVVAGVIVCSGYWFGRNYLLAGSPIFPLNLLPPDKLAWSNILAYGPLLPVLDLSIYYPAFLYNYETGVGAQFAALAIPGCIALAVDAIRRRRYGLAVVALFPVFIYPLWLFRSSRSLHTLFRYVLPAVPLGFAAAGWYMRSTRHPGVLRGVAITAVLFSIVNAVPRVGAFLLPDSVRSSIVAFRQGREELGRFDHAGDLAVQDYRYAWAYLDDLPPSAIAASHVIFAYPLIGPDFRHDLHFLHASNREAWLRQLRENGIDYVVLSELMRPNGELLINEGVLALRLEAINTGDEYVVAERSIPPRTIRGVRLRCALSASENVYALVGVNGFLGAQELEPRQGEQTVEIAWEGEVRSLEIALGFVPRTSLTDEMELRLSSIELITPEGELVALPRDASTWGPGRWPIEAYWMQDQRLFDGVLEAPGFWGSTNTGLVRIYRVLGGEEGEARQPAAEENRG